MHRGTHQRGYTLVEVLVVVLVLGILSALAIPTFLAQRASALRNNVRADIRNAATLVVAHTVTAGGVPDGLRLLPDVRTPSDATEPLLITAVSDGVQLAYAVAEDGQHFCIAGAHENLDDAPVAVYDSVGGTLGDACSFDADLHLAAAVPGPATFAARFREDSTYISSQTEDGGFSTGTWGRELLVDGHDLTSGVFELDGTEASYGGSGGGWAVVVHGSGDGDDFAGYTVQLDRGYGGGEFVLREWVPVTRGADGGRTGGGEQSPVRRVQAPDDFDWEAAHDIRVEVDGPSVRLLVGGEEVLTYDEMTREQGAFGVRTWNGTELQVDASRVTTEVG